MEANPHRIQQGHALSLKQHRRLPVGADVLPSGGVHFQVWASRYTADWGQVINYADEHAGPVREFFLTRHSPPCCSLGQARPAPQIFVHSKLNLSEWQRYAEIYTLHRDLLQLRQTDTVFRSQRPGGVDGAVLGPKAFVLRFFGVHGDDRLLVTNLGSDLHLSPVLEPLLALPEDMD